MAEKSVLQRVRLFKHFKMKTVTFVVGLVFICCEFRETAAEVQLEGTVQSECRDRFFWIRVTSVQAPRFEAIDGDGVHPISKQSAFRCGYTISSFRMDGSTTFRASYYSCFTHNQDDEMFTFRLNVLVSDDGGRWTNHPVSAVCPGPTWTDREILCEEDYMEVNVNSEASCGGQKQSRQVWQEASSQAGRTLRPTWQLMFLQSDGRVSSLSLMEAQRFNYSLTSTPYRLVLRSPYKQAQAEVMMVEDAMMEFLPVFLVFRDKLLVVMVDMTMACVVNSGSFDGSRLLWEVPEVLGPLVAEGVGYESRSFSLGVDNLLLDKPTTDSKGFSLVQQDGLIKIGVPFGAEGGYRKSLVENNMYKEAYIIFLLYEHIFTLFYDDGISMDTRHRMVRWLETPLVCRPPFSLNKTSDDQQLFRVSLENVPADVILEEVWINGNLMSESPEGGFRITPVLRPNGSGAYELQLPFEEPAVRWKYMGGGVVHHSIDVNFTLTLMPRRESYYHHTQITARTVNTFPPQITAQCLEGGIFFRVVKPHQTRSLWEVGVDHEALTPELVDQRGYLFFNDSRTTTLEVPIFSLGYTYEKIDLSNFYATFKLLLRDSKTLEVQTSTSKRCLFRTQDMIVCSADGTMTVVVTPTATQPAVDPEKTHLLDPTCTPKQTDGVRVLFEFRLDSCGTKTMAGEWYVVYENEILYKRLLIADGSNAISRESQFRVTVRCFYPLAVVNRLFVDRLFRAETPGFGLVSDSHAGRDCPPESSELITETNEIFSPAAEDIDSYLHFRRNKLFPEAQTHKVSLQGSSHPRPYISMGPGLAFSNSPHTFDAQIDDRIQLLPPNPFRSEFVAGGPASSGLDEEHLSLLPDSSGSVSNALMVEPLGSASHIPLASGLRSLAYTPWHADPTWNRFATDRSLYRHPDLSQRSADLTLFGSSIGEVTNQRKRPSRQPESQSWLRQAARFYQLLRPQQQTRGFLPAVDPVSRTTAAPYSPPESVSHTETNSVHLNQNQTDFTEKGHLKGEEPIGVTEDGGAKESIQEPTERPENLDSDNGAGLSRMPHLVEVTGLKRSKRFY